MNAYRMLEILEQQNQFELLEGEDGFHTPQDIRLVYLMNDAAECFLTFRNARITGEYLPDYSGELKTRLDRGEERSSLVVHQGHNVFTLFFEKLEPEYELYNYGEIGHFWVKGYEYLRQLEYRIAILWDKYEYMGEDCCSEMEQKLAWLAKFPPLNFTCYPSVPPQYLPDREDGWQLAPEALDVMLELAGEAGDAALVHALKLYRKHSGRWMSKYLAVLLHRKSHAKTVDLLAEKLRQAAAVHPSRSFGPERDGQYGMIMQAARAGQQALAEKGIQSVVLREEPFVHASDTLDFKAHLMIWMPGMINRKTEIRTFTYEKTEHPDNGPGILTKEN